MLSSIPGGFLCHSIKLIVKRNSKYFLFSLFSFFCAFFVVVCVHTRYSRFYIFYKIGDSLEGKTNEKLQLTKVTDIEKRYGKSSPLVTLAKRQLLLFGCRTGKPSFLLNYLSFPVASKQKMLRKRDLNYFLFYLN